MYNVTITNNYSYEISVDGKTVIKPKAKQSFTNWGTHTVDVPGMGSILFLDLGDKKIAGYELKETWGALFRYEGEEVYYRYEGQGEVDVALDMYGNMNVKTNFSSIIISLPQIVLESAG